MRQLAPRRRPDPARAPTRSVQEAVVYLQKVDKGKAWEKAAKPPEINNVKCDFQPHVQVMPVGDIDIVNSDPVLHNTHGFLDKLTVFNVALPNQDQRIKKPLKKSGLVRVECDAHGWMLGWIFVAENPYYAVTGKDGVVHHQGRAAGLVHAGGLAGVHGPRRGAGDREGQGGGDGPGRAEEEVGASATAPRSSERRRLLWTSMIKSTGCEPGP